MIFVRQKYFIAADLQSSLIVLILLIPSSTGIMRGGHLENPAYFDAGLFSKLWMPDYRLRA
ncbi:MAG TPA: hypothetical protein ENG83_03550 [Nitrospirae bacterium]|nr:hypothetical protein BMS3Abin06_00694 [bacterium BMS3Abin06]HDH11270.1 hypothetical protein [Nitrospirota bacterium]HDY99896.1 hypothetical protein [Nitrospirota bacterium]